MLLFFWLVKGGFESYPGVGSKVAPAWVLAVCSLGSWFWRYFLSASFCIKQSYE